MPYTPDQLAARFAPRVDTGSVHTHQLTLSTAAVAFAEAILDVLPRGIYQYYALEDLELVLHRAFDGTEAALGAAPVPTPYARAGQPAEPDSHGDAGAGPNVSLWRTGLRGAMHLHPLARLVAYTLADAADHNGRIADGDQPAVEDLALGAGLDVGTVLQALEELATHGWISRHNDGGMTRYQLRTPDPVAERNAE